MQNCDFSNIGPLAAVSSPMCDQYLKQIQRERGNINIYQIYQPLCDSNSFSHSGRRLMHALREAGSPVAKSLVGAGGEDIKPSPCVNNYIGTYLNRKDVQVMDSENPFLSLLFFFVKYIFFSFLFSFFFPLSLLLIYFLDASFLLDRARFT